MAPLRPYALISSDPRNSREGIRKAATLRPRPRFVLVILPAGKIPLYGEPHVSILVFDTWKVHGKCL